jgi:Kef-type K+ transport system membrane component KefB
VPTLSFNGLLIVALVAVAVPLLLELVSAAHVPPVVLEIIGGAVVGPFGLGFVHVDIPIQVLSDLGLGFLLFLAGYEIDLSHFRGQPLRLALAGFGASIILAVAVSYLAYLGGAVKTPLLIAIPLMSTSLGVLLPVLRDAGATHTVLGQLVITASSIAEFAPIVLLSLFFSATSTSPVVQTALLAGFAAAVVVAGFVLLRVGHLPWLTRVLHRLEHTSSQLRVRIAITIALAFGVAAQQFGLATILGAFLAGVIVRLLGQHEPEEQQLQFGHKLDALGFGFLIPIFFVTTGLGIDVRTLFASPIALVKVPMFVVAFLIVRGIPALAYRRVVNKPLIAAAALLQATTRPSSSWWSTLASACTSWFRARVSRC